MMKKLSALLITALPLSRYLCKQRYNFFYLLLHVKVVKIHLCIKSNEKQYFLHSFTQFLALLLNAVCFLLQ